MAHKPRHGDAIFVRPRLAGVPDHAGRPLAESGQIVAWNDHYQRRYAHGDLHAFVLEGVEMVHLSAAPAPSATPAAPPSSAPAPSFAPAPAAKDVPAAPDVPATPAAPTPAPATPAAPPPSAPPPVTEQGVAT